MTAREQMLAGELYLADDPELQAMLTRSQALQAAFNAGDRDGLRE